MLTAALACASGGNAFSGVGTPRETFADLARPARAVLAGAKYGNILIQPTTGTRAPFNSQSSRRNEQASIGIYSVNLTRYGVGVEITAARRTRTYIATWNLLRCSMNPATQANAHEAMLRRSCSRALDHTEV